MAASENGAVALLSLHPKYAYGILEGTKQVEFRKVPFKRDVTHIVIYATLPVGRVVGVFHVDFIRSASPSSLWSEFSSVGGIEKPDFHEYYAGRSVAYAIGVKSVRRLEKPLPLSALGEGLRPPQSFTYLPENAIKLVDAVA